MCQNMKKKKRGKEKGFYQMNEQQQSAKLFSSLSNNRCISLKLPFNP